MSYGNISPYGVFSYGQHKQDPYNSDVANIAIATQVASVSLKYAAEDMHPYGVASYGEVKHTSLLANKRTFPTYGDISYGSMSSYGGDAHVATYGVGNVAVAAQVATTATIKYSNTYTYGAMLPYGDILAYGKGATNSVSSDISQTAVGVQSVIAEVVKQASNVGYATQNVSYTWGANNIALATQAVSVVPEIRNTAFAAQVVSYSLEKAVSSAVVASQAVTVESAKTVTQVAFAGQGVTSSREMVEVSASNAAKAKQFYVVSVIKPSQHTSDTQLGNAHHKRKNDFEASVKGKKYFSYNTIGA